MNGYELAEEIFKRIGKNPKHEISYEDMIRTISFWGFNEEASKSTTIGFVCYCARQKFKKIFEQALVFGNFGMYNKLKTLIDSLEVTNESSN